MISIRNILKKILPHSLQLILLKLRVTIIKIQFHLSILLITPFRNRLFITYQNELKTDGIGAQLHRILAIYSLSKRMKINYFHSPLVDFTIHPMDTHQSKENKSVFLKQLNDLFKIKDSRSISDNCTLIKSSGLSFRLFTKISLAFFMNRNSSILLSVVEPFKFVDCDPKIYSCLNKVEIKFVDLVKEYKVNHNCETIIALHYRRGVGGMVIQPGESKPRELPFYFYNKALSKMSKQNNLSNYKIVVLSDSPKSDLVFKPEADQLNQWIGTPNYQDGFVSIQGMDIRSQFQSVGYNVEVISGGDPLDALKIMARAKLMILSQSSLSYVAALLNPDADIYYPSGFWHPPLKHWTVLEVPQ